MTVLNLYEKLNELIPQDLSCDWDNDGIMCMPDGDREVKKVLLALDVTQDVSEYAVKYGFDLIISHHPLIFRPVKNLTNKKLLYLVQNGVSVFSFHTRLDKLNGGVNTALAERLCLTELERFGEDCLGVIGVLKTEMTDIQFALKAKELLGAPYLDAVLTGRVCRRVAVVGGDGEDYIDDAYKAGADLYLSGRLSYNDMTDASVYSMSLVAAGHYFTENPVLTALHNMLKSIDSGLTCEKIESNLIKTI